MTTTLKTVAQPISAAAMKAERERDAAQAMRDYEAEQSTRQANMERLRALRLAKERTDALMTAARRLRAKTAAKAQAKGRQRAAS